MLNDGNWQRSSITKLDIADGKDEKKRQKQKQNKHNYTHCEFPGYSICGINLL
jgi:hypothetical protein